MWEALFFYGLGLYGALMIVIQCVQLIERRQQPSIRCEWMLVVSNSEEKVEGVLRSLIRKSSRESDRARIVVLDILSSDATALIVRKLSTEFPVIEYVRVQTEHEVREKLVQNFPEASTVRCILDLREAPSESQHQTC